MLTKPRVSLVREDIGDDSQTFFYGSCICHRTGSQSRTIHNPRKNAFTLRLLPIQLHVRGSCVVFGRHVTKQPSDWPELFGMARTKESAQRYQTTFCGYFISGSGGLGTRLMTAVSRSYCLHNVQSGSFSQIRSHTHREESGATLSQFFSATRRQIATKLAQHCDAVV